jgi:hypothetical protein
MEYRLSPPEAVPDNVAVCPSEIVVGETLSVTVSEAAGVRGESLTSLAVAIPGTMEVLVTNSISDINITSETRLKAMLLLRC